ncbi:MAG: YceH family protein [Gemmatimonadaceae bacterium]
MLTPPLTDVEVRILGSLAEKAVTTPDNYPLSISALAAACNQTTSREPVMRLEEGIILESIVTLRRRSLLRAIQPAGSRVTKYLHLLDEALDLDAREIAVLGVLMLRGAQTLGELHSRTTRLAEFVDVAAVEATLNSLVSRESGALAVQMQRRAGQKELRYAHLLSGEPSAHTDRDSQSDVNEQVAGVARSLDRVAELERVVTELRAELTELHAQFAAFRAEFQ